MKTTLQIVVILAMAINANPQGTFQNLDFEQANPVYFPGGAATTASALPYWTVLVGGVQQRIIAVNSPTYGASSVTLLSPGVLPTGFGVFTPIDGNYSVLLESFGSTATPSISQTGVIPAGTQSLLFSTRPTAWGPINLMMGTQSVPYTEVETGPNYIVYGANISAWAGQSVELTFSDPYAAGSWELDDISFSPNAVPEPNSFALIGIGGLFFAGYRRFAPKRA